MIRPANESDLPALEEVEKSCFGDDAWTFRRLSIDLQTTTRGTVVDDSGRGYAMVSVVDDVADLERIAVLPDARRSGLATRLLAAILDLAAGRGGARVLLEVEVGNIAARALYESLGFTQIARRRGYYGAGHDALVLARRCAS